MCNGVILNQPQTLNQNQPSNWDGTDIKQPLIGSFNGSVIQESLPPPIGEQKPELLLSNQPSSGERLQDRLIISSPPPFTLYRQAHHEALPDRERMIKQCGRPKDDLFFGLIHIRMSTAYKSVLTNLDKVQQALGQLDKSKTTVEKLKQAITELKTLDQVTDQYINDPGKHRFKTEIGNLKKQIAAEIQSLQDLQKQLNDEKCQDLPNGLSPKEAIAYAREGINLKDMVFFRDNRIEPHQARNLIENNPEKSKVEDEIKSIRFKSYPEKVCQDAQALRNEIHEQITKKGGNLPFDKIPTLINQAEYAVKLYVDLFMNSGKIPEGLLKDEKGNNRSHAKLENLIEKFPMAELPDSDRQVAAKLMNLIHENTDLINLKYKDFDPRFTVPDDATKDFLQKDGDFNSSLKPYRKLAESMLIKNLQKLVPQEKLRAPENPKVYHNNINIISNHFEGFLRDRPDMRVAFGLLEEKTQTEVLKQWLENSPVSSSIKSDEKKKLLQEKLPELLKAFLPNFGKNGNIVMAKQIGEGSFGKVYNGTFNKESIVVKLITISTKKTSYAEVIVESLHQAELCNNPHVPKFIGLQPQGSGLLVFMEKVDGGNYYNLLKEKLPIDSSKEKQQQSSNSRSLEKFLLNKVL